MSRLHPSHLLWGLLLDDTLPGGALQDVDTAWVLASGVGIWAHQLASMYANNVVAMDVDPAMTAHAQKICPEQLRDRVHYITADATKLHESLPSGIPLHAQDPRVIWLRYGVMLLDGAEGSGPGPSGQARLDTIFECYRRLRPGGKLIVEDGVSQEFFGATGEMLEGHLLPSLERSDRDTFTGTSTARVLYKNFPGRMQWRLWRQSAPRVDTEQVRRTVVKMTKDGIQGRGIEPTPRLLDVLDTVESHADADQTTIEPTDTRTTIAQIAIYKPRYERGYPAIRGLHQSIRGSGSM